MARRPHATHDGVVLNIHRRLACRAPFCSLLAAVLALLLIPSLALGADWTRLDRVTTVGGSRLDSLHQAASARGVLHLVHARLGPGRADDKVVYQRSTSDGKRWSGERAIFKANARYRKVVPNLAIEARDDIVAVAFRVGGASRHTLFVRVSRDGGRSFGKRLALFSTKAGDGIGVPAVAVGNDVIAVAWTNRSNGGIKVRTSRDDGRSFKGARTLGTTKVSIDCKDPLTDGLVGIAANDRSLHVSWSDAGRRLCYADDIKDPHLARSRRQLEPCPHHHRARLVRLGGARRTWQDPHRHGPGHGRRPDRVSLGQERAQLA